MTTLKPAADVREEQKNRFGAEAEKWFSKIAHEIDRELDGTCTTVWVEPPPHLRGKIKSRLEALGYIVTVQGDDQRDAVSLRIDW